MSPDAPGNRKKNRIPRDTSPAQQPGSGGPDGARQEPDRRSSELVAGIPGVVWEAYGQPDAAQQRIDFISPSVETMLGYSVQEWLSTPNFWLSIVHSEDRDRAAAAAADAFSRGVAHTNQFRWLTKDGRTLWVESHSTVVRDTKGIAAGMRGVTVDVTARKHAEEELRQNLEDLSRMQEVSTRLMQAGNFADLLRDILAAAIDITGAHMGNIQLLNSDALRIAVHQGFSDPFLEFFDEVQVHKAACGTALERGERVIVEDVSNSPIFLGTPALDVLLSAGVRAVQSTPLISRSGRTLGMFSTHYRHAPVHPSDRALRLLDILARQAADLIETKQADEAVRAREAQLQRLISDTPFMLTRCSRDLRYTFVSRAYADMVGRTSAEIEGRPIAEIMGDEGFATIRPHIDAVLSGNRVEYESEVRFAGIGERSLRVVYVPDRVADDAVTGWIASILDVTEEKQTSDARALVSSIVETSYDAIVTKDLDGIITSWNTAAEQLFGYSAAEMIGNTIRVLIPQECQSEEDDILARLRQGERIEHFETVRIAKDGRRMNVSVTISPLRNAAGTIIGASKIARDVSALRAAEAERLRLIQENATITEALNNVGAVVASDLDRDKVVQAVTDAATELTTAEFGAFFYNVVNDAGESYTLYMISGVPREAFAQFPMPRNTDVFGPTFKGTAIVRSADITKDPRYGRNPPYRGMPQGHLPVRSYLAVPVKGRHGDVIGGLFFGHSEIGRFTEQHERLAAGVASWAAVALENAHMFSVVREASRLKDEFLASLSHELRTPLNAVLGYARMLRAGIVTGEKQTRAIDAVERNATSLSQIVEDVLDISRIIAGKIRLSVQAVDFPQIVGNAVDAVLPAADAKGVRIETVLDPHASPVSGDPERLQQVLWNLLSNAVKFTNRGGKVQVRLGRVKAHVELSVADTGVGISPEFLPHVFERFRQADGSIARERGGLGLGLSIARQLVEMHGGTIDAASDGVGQGSTFLLTLPLMSVHPISRDDSARVHPRPAPGAQNIAPGKLEGLRVVAVDDDADAVNLVAELLEAAGALVRTAASAADALRLVETDPPQVLVTDLGMPLVDGFQLIDRIRTHHNPLVRRVPAAALTAYARSEDRVKALRAGFQIHLAKPIDPTELVTTIAALAQRFGPDGVDDTHRR
jgi:PAS domain S-box-containing protein